MLPSVKEVHPDRNYTLNLVFSNGETRQFDMKPYLDKGIFTRLKDWRCFQKARISLGTVVWEEDLDVAPETLYLESVTGHPGPTSYK